MKTERKRRNRRLYIPWGCITTFIFLPVLLLGLYFSIPALANKNVGPVSEKLNGFQKFQYSALMLWYDGFVTKPMDLSSVPVQFTIAEGESAVQVAGKLENAKIIPSADAFVAYLVYAGLDTGLQAGNYELNPAFAPIQIAQKLQDATPTDVKFVVLPGWRLEEIAANLPTSGLDATPEQFLEIARYPQVQNGFLPEGAGAEGFLLPGEYRLPRVTNARQLVSFLMNNASMAISPELQAGFSKQNLNVYQAVILASIVQREAIQPSEQPMIASVFLNRLAAGMRLETDPTIQYALGYNTSLKTWWKVPLSTNDLAVDSPYNTYLYPGLPPGPICNPSLSALKAVAYPAQTNYYYFRARCDNSKLHSFSETYEEHLQNGCP